MTTISRRTFLGASAAATVTLATGPAWWREVYAAPTVAGPGPYGLLGPPDANGLRLPAGFTSRIVARSGQPVGPSGYVWPPFPDGAATFPAPDGGWFHAVNSEVLLGGGGVSAIRYAADGTIVDAYSILRGTSGNCAGGPTPWGTWLSCEEAQSPSNIGEGRVWECDPSKPGQGIVRPAMGSFNHEAAAVDPVGGRVYLTEDRRDGRFYRFTPARYPDLSTGLLEVAIVADGGATTWVPVPDPTASTRTTRTQVPASTAFDGGEGCWYDDGFVYFTTKGDDKVWVHDVAGASITVLYDAADFGDDPPLFGVDNIVVARSGDVLVAEDGGDMRINLITRERTIAPLLRYEGNDASELTGPVFDPSGTRLYFSSQRGPAPVGPGVTFEVTGPFRTERPSGAAGAPTTSTTLGSVAPPPTGAPPPRVAPSAPATLPATGGYGGGGEVIAAALAGVAALVWRMRRPRDERIDPQAPPQG